MFCNNPCHNILPVYSDSTSKHADYYDSTVNTSSSLIHGSTIYENRSNDNTLDLHCSDSFVFTKKGFHVSCLNICHLLPKLDEVKYYLSRDMSTDIFGISETFLHSSNNDNLLEINGFSYIRKDRDGKKGGGLLVYVADKIPYIRRVDLETGTIESIWMEVNYKYSRPFLLNFVYRPPNSPQSWIDHYEQQLALADSTKLDYYMLGDFNINIYHPSLYAIMTILNGMM